jgi:hypothetical protein
MELLWAVSERRSLERQPSGHRSWATAPSSPCSSPAGGAGAANAGPFGAPPRAAAAPPPPAPAAAGACGAGEGGGGGQAARSQEFGADGPEWRARSSSLDLQRRPHSSSGGVGSISSAPQNVWAGGAQVRAGLRAAFAGANLEAVRGGYGAGAEEA